MRSFHFSAAACAAAALIGPAQAATVFSEDFNGATAGNYGTGQNVGKFTVTKADVDIFGKPATAYACPDGVSGNLCLDLNGNSNGEITSDAMALAAGTKYTVSFKMAGNGEPFYPSPTYPYTFDVLFGGTTHSYSIAPVAPFQAVSFDFTAASSQMANLAFRSTYSGIPTYWGAIIDDVSVTSVDAAVPEPATWATMIAGFGTIGGALRRRKGGAPALA